MGIAFFDVDRTLLACNSAALWIRRESRLGHISRMQALRGAFWIALYGLGFARMEDVIIAAIASLHGMRERDVIHRTLAFWQEEVRGFIRPGARAAIERHRARGDHVILLTSSSNYLCAPITDELQLDGFLANRMVVENGTLTGEAYLPICFGQGKVTHAQALADKMHISLASCSFYTDSYSDLPMLLAVGSPVVVHPDPRLRRLALRRGWPIEDWNAHGLLPDGSATDTSP